MPPDDFAVFVLTHGRPDSVHTASSLRRAGYTGKLYLVVDDGDRALEQYRKRFGDDVLTFSKSEIAERFDQGDNFDDRRAVFYARNACFDLARQVGVRYFMQCDDDYVDFRFRVNHERQYGSWLVQRLDDVLVAMLDYFKTIPALSIAMSQSGDHMGGVRFAREGKTGLGFSLRKAMNTFLCDVERPFSFVGRVNEDVNTYTSGGRRGELFLTIPTVVMTQKQTQTNPGGMTELYQDSGTYLKSFYTVMYCPSAVTVGFMRTTHARIHHRIIWKNTAAQIVASRYRKPSPSAPTEWGEAGAID